ncbi:hypothetical protein [Streptomyces sp. NPDC088775]|uniref:hypothetical protein n=1 Tax=Streptomyces sp. NPDC088775 TaxID=3365896 RepID=UPI00381800E5
MNESTTCLICHRGLHADELGRYACHPCERRIDRDLMAIAGPTGLYARVSLRITPGSGGGGPAVSMTRTPGTPTNLDVLSYISSGGLVSELESWVEDWSTYGLARPCQGGRLQHRVDWAVGTLRLNLARAVERHPAIDDFAVELAKIRRRCEGVISQERTPRRFGVLCPCSQTLRVTLDTPGCRCPQCGTQYGHSEVMDLPLAERRIAA